MKRALIVAAVAAVMLAGSVSAVEFVFDPGLYTYDASRCAGSAGDRMHLFLAGSGTGASATGAFRVAQDTGNVTASVALANGVLINGVLPQPQYGSSPTDSNAWLPTAKGPWTLRVETAYVGNPGNAQGYPSYPSNAPNLPTYPLGYVMAGTAVDVYPGAAAYSASAPYPYAGRFSVDATGNITDYTAGAFKTNADDPSIAPGTIQMVTHPVTFNFNGYNCGWHMLNNTVVYCAAPRNAAGTASNTDAQDFHYGHPDVYNLPASLVSLSGDQTAYTIMTPGSVVKTASNDPKYRSSQFSVDLNGNVTIQEPGAAGLAVTADGKGIEFTNVSTIEYQLMRSTDGGETWTPVSLANWWSGFSGFNKNAVDNRKDPTDPSTATPGWGYIYCVAGEYPIGNLNGIGVTGAPGLLTNLTEWTRLSDEATGAGNVSGAWRTFEVPDNDGTFWSETFMIEVTGEHAQKGDLYMMTLTRAETVPEPATMSLLALGGLALLRRRR